MRPQGRVQLRDHDITVLSAVPAPVAAQLSPPSEALGGHDLEDSAGYLPKHSMHSFYVICIHENQKDRPDFRISNPLKSRKCRRTNENVSYIFCRGGEGRRLRILWSSDRALHHVTYTPPGIVRSYEFSRIPQRSPEMHWHGAGAGIERGNVT